MVVPPFKLGGSKYDQMFLNQHKVARKETFSGRLRHFLDVTDPRTLLTPQSELENCIRRLQQYKDGDRTSSTDKELWKAQKITQDPNIPVIAKLYSYQTLLSSLYKEIVSLLPSLPLILLNKNPLPVEQAIQAIIHPDTGKKILMPFRMSGYVPFGTPMVVGLLLPNQTIFTTIFWQWLNQSHNACVNYSNRNATKETSMKDFALGYAGAVTSALSIAVGLNVLLKNTSNLSPAKRMLMQRFIPFPAVAAASVCNVVLMRKKELSTGIEVTEKNGTVVGVSKVAAKKALKETAATRAVLPAPILIIPPIIMATLERTKWFPRYPRLNLPVQVLVCTLSFGLALPVAIAMFPQMSQINVKDLEKEIQEKTEHLSLYYNKGL